MTKFRHSPYSPLPNARTVHIESQGQSIALSVLANHPQAVTVLFYPGTMASPFMYSVLLEEIYAQGCNVVGIHPLGHGLSSRKNKTFTFADILQNGRDAEAWVRTHFQGPIVVCGHSQGGILTLAHALNNPHIQAIFPLCTLLPEQAQASKVTRFGPLLRYRKILLGTLRVAARLCPIFPVPFWAYLDGKKVLKNAQYVMAPTKDCRLSYPLSMVSSLFNWDLSAATKEGNIHCPVYLMVAKDDALFTLPMMREVFECIKAPQKKLLPHEGGGHLSVASLDYAPIIAAHLAEQCAGLGLPLYQTRKG